MSFPRQFMEVPALFRRTGEDWLWFSRLAMTDDALRAIIHDPAVEVYPLMVGEQEAGLRAVDRRGASEPS